MMSFAVERSMTSLEAKVQELEAANKKLTNHKEILKSEYKHERRQRKQLQQQLEARRLSFSARNGQLTTSKGKFK